MKKRFFIFLAASTFIIASIAYFIIKHSGVLRVLADNHEYIVLFTGIAIILIVVACQWHAIVRSHRIDRISLGAIEETKPRLIGRFETATTKLLTVVIMILSVQSVSIVFGIASFWTLLSTTAEVKDTIKVIMGDFDGDGDVDYIAGNYDTASVYGLDIYLNNGSGVFSNSTFGLSTSFTDFDAGDIDGDGDLDVISVQAGLGSDQKCINNGSAVFTCYTISTVALNKIRLLDVDNNGTLDFVALSSTLNSTQAVYLNDGHGVFTAANSTLPSTPGFAAADFNSDGYVDLAFLTTVGSIKVYANSGTGAFVSMGAMSAPGTQTSIVSSDVDGDGDIDLLITLDTSLVYVGKNNGNGGFSTGTNFGGNMAHGDDIAYGDLKNNSKFSVVIGGCDAAALNGGGETWQNDGAGVYTQDGMTLQPTDCTKSLAFGDIDADGDFDYVRGNRDPTGSSGQANRVYYSTYSLTTANTVPTAPTASTLTGTIISSTPPTTATVRLRWGSGSDSISATRMLQYQLKVGTGSNANNILSSKTASPNWVTRVMPNGQSKTMLLKNLPCGNTFYWNVATVDTGFMSTWSTEQSFTLSAGCQLTFGGGGGGGGGAATTTPSGGRLWRIPHEVLPPKILTGSLLVSAFEDINGNGKKDLREKNNFGGLQITASGSTASGVTVRKTLTLSQKGQVTFKLEQSDKRGYTMIVDTGSTVLTGFEPTGKTVSGSYIVRSESTASIAFGFRRQELLDYHPCLTVASANENDRSKPDVLILLGQLEDAFSNHIIDGVTLGKGLAKRADFLTLLARTQCIPLVSPPPRKNSKGDIKSLIDLPPLPATPNAVLLYSLLAADLPASRLTPKGHAADLSASISRREAITLIAASMKIPKDKQVTEGSLPVDLSSKDPLVSDFLTLRSLDILPLGFLTKLGAAQGISGNEAATLLTRAAFQAGRIGLLPIVFDKNGHRAAPPEEEKTLDVLDTFPDFPIRECLLTDSKRASAVNFSDLLPGDPLEPTIKSLLSRGTKNSDGKILWLLSATKTPTEFGILKGTPKISLNQPVSLFEAIRILLLLRCLPPPSAREFVLSNFKIEGSGESRVPRDRLSNLPRNQSFVSRTFYRAQDHERAFDLSLFTYAQDLLTGKTKSPNTPLSIRDGTSLLASGFLNLLVHETLLTPQEAETEAEDLALDLAKYFLNDESLDWRTSDRLSNLPLTRSMLLEFLGAVLDKEIPPEDAPETSSVKESLGEGWWNRLKE